MHRGAVIWLVVMGIGLLASACGADDDDRGGQQASEGLRVASFDFPESELLAELYAQAAEGAGTTVVRLGAIGPREVVAPALELGQVDLVPEYLGTALAYVGAPTTDPDPASALPELVDRLGRRGLTALGASPAQDVNVVVVSADTARRLDLGVISDLAPHADALRFGGPAECPERELCLIGLRERYRLEFAEFVPQPTLSFTAESLRRGEIDVGLMFSAAAELDAPGLVVLADDLGLQPAENIVPVVRLDSLDRWGPALVAALDAVSAELTTDELRHLNRRVADGEPVPVVAADWLARRRIGITTTAPRRGRGARSPWRGGRTRPERCRSGRAGADARHRSGSW